MKANQSWCSGRSNITLFRTRCRPCTQFLPTREYLRRTHSTRTAVVELSTRSAVCSRLFVTRLEKTRRVTLKKNLSPPKYRPTKLYYITRSKRISDVDALCVPGDENMFQSGIPLYNARNYTKTRLRVIRMFCCTTP